MSTFAELKDAVAAALFDESKKTFEDDTLGAMVNSALIEVGRIAPERFLETITPVADTLSYQLRAAGTDVDVTGEADTDILTSPDHGLVAGTAIRFTALTGGAGLSVGTVYFVISTGLTADAFSVAASAGGAVIDFTTDITAGTWKREGSDDPIDEIEVRRVEVWDGSFTPPRYVARLRPASAEYVNSSQTGWECWGGILYLTNAQESALDPDVDLIKVWGYSPFLPLQSDSDILTCGAEREQAIKDYCRVLGLRRLVLERDLFTQWQTRTNNTDVSPAALMNGLAQAEEDWRRRSRALLVLREAP